MEFKVNNCQFTGRLAADPKVKYFDSGSMITEFRIGIRNGQDKNGNPKTVWLNCKAFQGKNELAEYVANNFVKGDLIHIPSGKLDQEEWIDKDTGKKRSGHVLIPWKVTKVKSGYQAVDESQEDYEF